MKKILFLIAINFYVVAGYSQDMPEMGYGYVLPWGTNGTHWDMKYQYSEQHDYVEPSLDANGHAWTDQGYDDSNWPTLTGPMASPTKHHATCVYLWEGEYNCFNLRRTFQLEKNPNYTYKFSVCHDDDFILYINGKEVVNEGGWMDYWFQYSTHEIPADVLVNGENTLAIFIKQNWGSAYLDYSLYFEAAGNTLLTNKLNQLKIVYEEISTMQKTLKDSINIKADEIEKVLSPSPLDEEVKNRYLQETASYRIDAENLINDYATTNSQVIQELSDKVTAYENGSTEYSEEELSSEIDNNNARLYSDDSCLSKLTEILNSLKAMAIEVDEAVAAGISTVSKEINNANGQYSLNGMQAGAGFSGVVVRKDKKFISK